jgi:hypothetical protein
MKLRSPSFGLWVLAVVLGGAGLLMRFGILHITGLGIDSFWFVAVGFVILAVATLLK